MHSRRGTLVQRVDVDVDVVIDGDVNGDDLPCSPPHGAILRREAGYYRPVRTTTTLLASSLLLLAACGGAAPSPTAPSTPGGSTAATVAATPATAAPARRTPSEELRRYWAMGDTPRFALYADFAGLMHTELGAAIVPAALQLASGSLTADQARCLRGALDGVREIVFGADDDDGLIVARIDEQALNPSTCLGAAGAKPVQLEGANEAYTFVDGTLVHEPGFLVLGRPAVLKRALAQRAAPKALPASMSLGPDEYVVWSAQLDEDVHVAGTVLASSSRFRVAVQADLPPRMAAGIEKQFGAVQTMGGIPGLGDGPEREIVSKLLHAVELKRDGGHLEGALDLREPPADQARDLGAAASLGVLGVRKYMAEAKTAEARNAVGQIAKDYAAWWETADDKSRAKKKLVSFPPVPKTVPRGTKIQSTPADWKPWAPIKFAMDRPQYYQYEVRAAKNGESAEIIARGDLDGDGQTSQFKLSMHVDRARGALVIDPSIAETDPEE
jgi:hypothetical protein